MSKIAFFTLNAYDMLTGGHGGDAVGGAQLQQILIGNELAQRGHKIYFVEYDTGNKIERTINGIEIITKPQPSGSELSRAFTVLKGTREILTDIDPDVCYRRSLDFEMLPLSLYCSITDARFVYGVAHDDELTDQPHKFDSGLKNTKPYKWLNRQSLSNADGVIVQNGTQLALARNRLETDIQMIPNCYKSDQATPTDWSYESPVVFWAARYQPWKRPDLVAELAEELPEITFVMAGGTGNKDLYEEVRDRSQNLENLKLLGHVPFSEIDSYFAAADIFLNTSDAEGFPNTFLQAWAQKTPVVSLQVDPNDILTTQDVGFVANGSMNRLRNKIQELTDDSNKLKKLSQTSYEYLSDKHTVEAIADRYEHIFFKCDT